MKEYSRIAPLSQVRSPPDAALGNAGHDPIAHKFFNRDIATCISNTAIAGRRRRIAFIINNIIHLTEKDNSR